MPVKQDGEVVSVRHADVDDVGMSRQQLASAIQNRMHKIVCSWKSNCVVALRVETSAIPT